MERCKEELLSPKQSGQGVMGLPIAEFVNDQVEKAVDGTREVVTQEREMAFSGDRARDSFFQEQRRTGHLTLDLNLELESNRACLGCHRWCATWRAG